MARERIRGWTALFLFAVLYIASTKLEPFIARPIIRGLGLVFGPFGHTPPGEVPAQLLIGLCVARVILVITIMGAAALVDQRPIWSYGLDTIRTSEILRGLLAGFFGVALVAGGLYLTGHLHVSVGDGKLSTRLIFALIWAIGMVLVGVSEELQFRGLPLIVLARVTSPLAACAVSAGAFMLVHLLNNSDETVPGLIQIVLFGAVGAISVMVTGRLAWCIAFHASWDWTLETLLGAIGSGYRFHGSLLKVDASGPAWLTGGPAGLEGSVLSIGILSLGLITSLFWWARRKRDVHAPLAQTAS